MNLGIQLPDLTCPGGVGAGLLVDDCADPRRAQITLSRPGLDAQLRESDLQLEHRRWCRQLSDPIGTVAAGANDIYAGSPVTNLAAFVSELPREGGTIWVRLSSTFVNGDHRSSRTTATAADTTTQVGAFVVGNGVHADGYDTQTAEALQCVRPAI